MPHARNMHVSEMCTCLDPESAEAYGRRGFRVSGMLESSVQTLSRKHQSSTAAASFSGEQSVGGWVATTERLASKFPRSYTIGVYQVSQLSCLEALFDLVSRVSKVGYG